MALGPQYDSMRTVTALLSLCFFAGCSPTDDFTLPNGPPGPQALSLLGDSLTPLPASDSVGKVRRAELDAAHTDYQADPTSADALIWLGRRLAYIGYYRTAIDVYASGFARHPEDPRFLRHRGHRYISLRQLDNAIDDFSRATKLVQGQPDEVEPDGLPNARGIPTGTIQSNIWYHLGLAHYLKGDFQRALSAYLECQKVSNNPDMLVATSHWHYMTLRRMGREDEAAAVLEPIHADLDVIENHTYHRLLLMYKGELTPEQLLDDIREEDALQNATMAYGIGNWFLYNGDADRAREIFEEILTGPQWAAFGYLAAEAELASQPR